MVYVKFSKWLKNQIVMFLTINILMEFLQVNNYYVPSENDVITDALNMFEQKLKLSY